MAVVFLNLENGGYFGYCVNDCAELILTPFLASLDFLLASLRRLVRPERQEWARLDKIRRIDRIRRKGPRQLSEYWHKRRPTTRRRWLRMNILCDK